MDAVTDDATPKRRPGPMIVAIVVAVLVAALVALLITRDDGDAASTSPLIGVEAPPVAGETMDGGEFDLADHRGEWVVVNFFGSWCPPCRLEHPELVAFDEGSSGAVLVGVAFDDTPEGAQEFFDELGGDWPVLVTDTSRWAVGFGVTGAPETYLIDPDGVVRRKWIAPITAAELNATIAALDAERVGA